MHKIYVLSALAASSVAVAQSAPFPMPLDQPSYDTPILPSSDVEQVDARKACDDRIRQVRATNGRPQLDRSPAGAEEPLLHYAVDRRIDGCGVIVPVADPADIRQSPPPGKPMLRPPAATLGHAQLR